jgi:hypothetical protein|tara:strand:+ start:3988 stop:4479 length:492 start_codon:yes stop_codon:yes gene_type:complete
MATTTSFGDSPVQITAIDGIVTRNANFTVEGYHDLSVPTGAIVNGIVITWTGGYSSGVDVGAEVMTVAYGGSGNSSVLAANSTPEIYSDISTVTYGSSTQLWGLTWTPAQANAITTKMFTESGTFYHDAFQVTIHYTASIVFSLSTSISSGIVKIKSGKVVIK